MMTKVPDPLKCQECNSTDGVKRVTMDIDLPTLTLCLTCRFLLVHPELADKLKASKNGKIK